MSKKNYSRQQREYVAGHYLQRQLTTKSQNIIVGTRVGPGELKEQERFKDSIKYTDQSYNQRLQYLIWIELQKLKTNPTLLVPGWTGFNITVRRNAVIVESNVACLDTIDSPATDLKTAFEVLCRASAIRDRLNLKAVACVFDQSFHAKAMEVFWKNRQLFKHLLIMMGGFHLIMMLLGVIGTRFGDAGQRELAIQSDAIAEGSIERANRNRNGKNYNRLLSLHKIFYEVLMILLLTLS